MDSFHSASSRKVLFATVSVIALAVASPQLTHAADMPLPPPVIGKAPPVMAPPPQFEWFVEGAGFWTAGGSVHYTNFGTPLAFKPRFGWQGAIGFDYRWGNPWHVSAQFRYGRAGKQSKSFYQIYAPYYSGSATHKEQHWVADFAVGRDVGIGAGQAQVKLGLRIAELKANTDGNIVPYPYAQRSKFLGFGPRVALEGRTPLAGSWTVDYMGGLAALYGNRKLRLSPGGSFNSRGFVFNVDASLGLSYWFTPNASLTAGYRVDAYWNGLRTFSSSGSTTNIDRIFHGPFVRLTGRY